MKAGNFEEFYHELPEQEKVMVDILREVVKETMPSFREKISYNVPYYFLNTRVCYIWPASVKPGPREGVVFGFCKGQLLSDAQGILEKEGRKEIATITYKSVEEIDTGQLREILMEAILIDELTPGKRRKRW